MRILPLSTSFLVILYMILLPGWSYFPYSNAEIERNKLILPFDTTNLNLKTESIRLDDLLTWTKHGQGIIGTSPYKLVELTEEPGSQGLMIVSPEAYGKNVIVSYDIMVLNPATVLVVMLSASDLDGSGNFSVPAGYDGSLATWPENTSDYFFSFHNSAHSHNPKLTRRVSGKAKLLQEAEETYLFSDNWHHIEAGNVKGKLWLTIDNQIILSASDNSQLGPGHVIFRLRGTGTVLGSCFIKNVVIRHD